MTYTQVYLLCVYLWGFLHTLVMESTIPIHPRIYSWPWYMMELFLLFKIIHDIKRDKKAWKGAILLLVGLLSIFYSQQMFLEAVFFFLAAGDQIKPRDIVKNLYSGEVLAVVLVVVFAALGLIPNGVYYRNNSDVARYAMGFSHPNSFAAKVLQLLLMRLYLKSGKLKLYHCLQIAVIGLAVYELTDSQTFFLAGVLTIILTLMTILSRQRGKVVPRLSRWLIRLTRFAGVISIIIVVLLLIGVINVYDVGFLQQERTALARARELGAYFQRYSVTLFGQPLYYGGSIETQGAAMEGVYTLDNGYAYMLLGFGIIPSILLLVGYFFLLRRMLREKNDMALIITAIFLIYGLSETAMIRSEYNFTLFLMNALVWQQPVDDVYLKQIPKLHLPSEKKKKRRKISLKFGRINVTV